MKNLILFTLLIILTISCNNEDKFVPKDINFDRDVCQVCLMGLTDQRYNVQAINEYGEVRWYDDIGCLAEDIRNKDQWEQWKGNKVKFYIGDASKENETNNWIDATTSFFDYGKHTPMGYGYSAYASKPHVDSIYSFDQVLDRIDKGFTMRESFLEEKMMMNKDNPEKIKKLQMKLDLEKQKKTGQEIHTEIHETSR